MKMFMWDEKSCPKVFVYRNLSQNCWSLKMMEGECKGRVIAHAEEVMLINAVFKVSEAGRQRVLKEKRKNVHAGVEADCITTTMITERYDLSSYGGASTDIEDSEDKDKFMEEVLELHENDLISYNPYRGPYFHYKGSGKTVHEAEIVYLSVDGKVYDLS